MAPARRPPPGRHSGKDMSLHPRGHSPAARAARARRKGALVRVNLARTQGSLEAAASDPTPPAYLLEGPAEILAVKGEHAQLRLRRPVPDVWLRLDQLEPYPG